MNQLFNTNKEKLLVEYTHLYSESDNEYEYGNSKSKGKLILTRNIVADRYRKKWCYQYYIKSANDNKISLLHYTYSEKDAICFFRKARKAFESSTFSLLK